VVHRESVFVITCESVGTVDSMCFPWQQQSARANETLKKFWFALSSCLEQGARSLSVFFNCGRSFAGNHCLRTEDFFFLW